MEADFPVDDHRAGYGLLGAGEDELAVGLAEIARTIRPGAGEVGDRDPLPSLGCQLRVRVVEVTA